MAEYIATRFFRFRGKTYHRGDPVIVPPGREWLISDGTVVEVVKEPAAVIDITPAALELAEEHDVDPATITGTGAGGRILLSDVEELIEE